MIRFTTDEDVKDAHIEEYVCGTNYCIHYFYSALKDEVEVLGMDSRYEKSHFDLQMNGWRIL